MRKIFLNIRIFFNFLMRGLHSADNLAFGAKEDSLSGGVNINKHIEQKSIWDDLLNGQITQEVKELRHETYYADKESKKYRYIGNGKVSKKNTLSQEHVFVEESDNLPIQIIQDNDLIPETVYETLTGIDDYGTDSSKHAIEISRNFIPRFKIEQYATKIVVKRKSETEAQLDLYCSIYEQQFNRIHRPFINEMQRIVGGYKQSDITDFNSLKFISYKAFGSEDSMLYEYDNIKFKEAIIFDGSFVLKFDANIICDGHDLTAKYYDEITAKKYENKEAKGTPIIGFTPNMTDDSTDFDIEQASKLAKNLLNNNNNG